MVADYRPQSRPDVWSAQRLGDVTQSSEGGYSPNSSLEGRRSTHCRCQTPEEHSRRQGRDIAPYCLRRPHDAVDRPGTDAGRTPTIHVGESASRIDWKATARLSSPYVREYEAESDQTTLLVFDARSSLGTGLPGETALDYLRTIALSHVAAAQRLGDPLGCYGIDAKGYADSPHRRTRFAGTNSPVDDSVV